MRNVCVCVVWVSMVCALAEDEYEFKIIKKTQINRNRADRGVPSQGAGFMFFVYFIYTQPYSFLVRTHASHHVERIARAAH